MEIKSGEFFFVYDVLEATGLLFVMLVWFKGVRKTSLVFFLEIQRSSPVIFKSNERFSFPLKFQNSMTMFLEIGQNDDEQAIQKFAGQNDGVFNYPIYNNTGDIQNFTNFRGIKLNNEIVGENN